MKRIKRFLAVLLTLGLLAPAVSLPESDTRENPEEEEFQQKKGIPEDWEAAQTEEEYRALSMWLAESEGTVKLFDAEDYPLELDDEMRFMGGTVLETEEESLAVVDMDRERLAIMDEISRAGFEKADSGNRISITLKAGAMYFRVGQPLEEEESFDVFMDDIRLAIRGTCGMVQQSEEGMSIILASGHAVITREPEGSVEPGDGQDEDTAGEPGEGSEEITIEAGEIVSVSKDETGGGIRFEKKTLAEDEVPVFLTEALRKDPEQLEKVYAETGWQPEKLFGEQFYMDYYEDSLRFLLEHDEWTVNRYALVYLTEEDTIPSLLVVDDTDGWYTIYNYDPESREVKPYYFTMHGVPHEFYTHEEGKGLTCWYRTEDGKLSINVAVWSEYGGPAYIGKFFGDDDKGVYWYLKKEIDWTYVK